MKIILLSLIAFAGIANAAHAQIGLTLAQCEAKFGKVGYNHGGCYWNRNGFKMEFGEGDTEPFEHMSYSSKHPLPIAQIWDENFPGGEFVTVSGFTPYVDHPSGFGPVSHVHRWVSKGMGLVFANEDFANGWYSLEIEMD